VSWLDHDFIANHTSGFEEARKAVESYDLEWTERTTGYSFGNAPVWQLLQVKSSLIASMWKKL